MRALLLGGAGFIGLHLARRLLDDGVAVTVVDDFSRASRDDELVELCDRGTHFIAGDLTGREVWDQVGYGWDEVYLLAAVVGVANVEKDPLGCLRINTEVVQRLIEWVEPGTKVFFSSTSEIYAGGVDAGIVPVPTAESVPVLLPEIGSPRLAYGLSKAWGEAAIQHASRATGFPAVIGRFHNVYGPRMGMSHVIPEMLKRASSGETPFRVWGADQSRAFCYVDDAVDGVVGLMRSPWAEGRTVHIGTPTETRIADLASLVLDVVGVDPPLQPLQAPPGSVVRRCPDVSLLEQLTGYRPQVSLDDGVRRTWRWYADRWSPALHVS